MQIENVRPNIPKLDICARRNAQSTRTCRIAALHYHDELEFLPVFKGSFLCRVDGVDYIAREGEIIFINAGVPHETFSIEPGSVTALVQFRESNYINTEIRKIIKYSIKFHSLESTPVRILNSKELFSIIENILVECEEKKNAYEIIVRSQILRIIGMLYRDNILSDGEQIFSTVAVQKILPALTYVNQNYSEDIDLSEISSMLGFDRSYFCRIFKLAIGATFTEYLNFVRICKAEKKLSSTDESILDISSSVGFSSISYFNRIFKKYKNCSPSAYRATKYCRNM